MAGSDARQRISVRVNNRDERDAAMGTLSGFDADDVHIYDGLVTGWADRATLALLMERGLLVDESSGDRSGPAPSLPEPPRVPGFRDAQEFEDLLKQLQEGAARLRDRITAPPEQRSVPGAAAQYVLQTIGNYGAGAVDWIASTMLSSARGLETMSGGRFTPVSKYLSNLALGAATWRSLPVTAPAETMYEVQLVGPMRPEWAEKLYKLGGVIASYVPPFRYRMSLSETQREEVSKLDFVHGVERYGLKATLGLGILDAIKQAQETPEHERKTFDLTVHFPRQVPVICRLIEQHPDVSLMETAGTAIRFQGLASSPFLVGLADREEVKSLDLYTPPVLLLEYARQVIGVSTINMGAPPQWDGMGEVVGILDSGVDAAHPDLADRIKSYQPALGASSTDTFGHGTHVAGIIAGTGKASGGKVVGVAPGAQLSVVGIVKPNGELIFPPDLTELLLQASRGDAKIINMSFGRPATNGIYDQYAESVDRFVYDNPEVLIVVAVGNDGTARSGYPDYQSVNSPATANNVIAVGACRTIRPGIANTWGAYDHARFPAPPVGDAGMAGSPTATAALSSRGPSQTRTIKPEVVAPGTFVLSAKAAGGTMPSYAPVPPGMDPYIFLNGTSMAAPFVSAAAAVLRQYLRQTLQMAHPSAALVKAMLCVSADRFPPLVNPKITPWFGYPDFDQGFGLVNLGRLIPHEQAGKRRVAFVDVANNSSNALASRQPDNAATRSSRSYMVEIADNTEALRVVVSWTDAPGPYVKNVLFLDVKGPMVALVGNHEHTYSRIGLFDTAGLNGVPYDRLNNTQIVCIEKPPPGKYAINVFAQNTFHPGKTQGYGLCVCGSLAGDLEPVKPAF